MGGIGIGICPGIFVDLQLRRNTAVAGKDLHPVLLIAAWCLVIEGIGRELVVRQRARGAPLDNLVDFVGGAAAVEGDLLHQQRLQALHRVSDDPLVAAAVDRLLEIPVPAFTLHQAHDELPVCFVLGAVGPNPHHLV